MNQKVTVLVIIAVVCAALAGVFGYRQSRASDQNRALQEQVMTLEDQNAQLKRQVDQLSAADTALRRDYDALKAENEELKSKHGKPAKPALAR
jgi:type II secretory pathway pseudopilin PulG